MTYMADYNVPRGGKTVLVLDIMNNGMIGYYFVDHENQSIFWLDPFDFLELRELRLEFTPSHVGEFPTVVTSTPSFLSISGLQMLAQYWYVSFSDGYTAKN